jgi:hypothetical protein
VRVLRFEKAIAIVFPVSAPRSDLGIWPDLIARLCEAALRTRMVSSAGVKSVIDKRWRGANGEVYGCDGELEYARDARRAVCAIRGRTIEVIVSFLGQITEPVSGYK